MTKQEFIDDLPTSTMCESCCRDIPSVDWGVGLSHSGDWMAVGIVKCEPCSWLKIAAAGSSESAHREAQYMRLKLIVHMGL